MAPPIPATASIPRPCYRLLRGPWPLWAGVAGLALLNVATLVLAGHPWSVTWAHALWGAQVAALAGWDPTAEDC